MSARASTPAVRLLAEAMIRHKPGSNGLKDGFLQGRLSTWLRVLARAQERDIEMSSSEVVSVRIPGPSASRSKMQKKGWKCWAKWLTSVSTPANDGYAYQGEFTDVETTVEASVGDVLLHVDQSQSADIGVVMLNSKGEAFIKWVAEANSDGRKWCGPLAKTARKLLAMSPEERIRHVAGIVAADRPENRTDEVQAYWERVAAGAAADPPAADRDVDPRAATIAQIRALMSEHGITVVDLEEVAS